MSLIIILLFVVVIVGLLRRVNKLPSGCTQDCYQGRRCTCGDKNGR
jgi:hypothetical protein